MALDEASIRDVRLFSGGLVQGLKLQDYVNEQVGKRPLERMRKPFAAVATRLETGERTVFTRGNTGQAVRASSSVPGVFEPVTIGVSDSFASAEGLSQAMQQADAALYRGKNTGRNRVEQNRGQSWVNATQDTVH